MYYQLLILVVCVGATLGASAPNGSKFNPNKVGGPLSKEQMSLLRHISYLGAFNNKEFYIVRIKVNQDTARTNCGIVGLKLAQPDQSELNFLYEVTSDADDYSWTDGEVGVKYFDGTHIDSDIGITSLDASTGLVIDRYLDATDLKATNKPEARYYLCYV